MRVDRRFAIPCSLLAIVLCAFHAMWLNAPFSVLQTNAGSYFGVFAENWDRLGFWETRGLPLMPKIFESIEEATPYVHHPPGLAWLFYALGGQEWSMRAPTLIATFVAAISWVRICRTQFSVYVSWWSAFLLTMTPCFAVHGQASFEPVIVACGLAVIAELVDPGRHSRTRRLTIVSTAAFFGTWTGWGFAFMGLACIPLAWRPTQPLRTLRPLLAPGTSAILAAATISLWASWALATPGATPPPTEDTDIQELVNRFVLSDWPSSTLCWSRLTHGVGHAWTPCLILAASIGVGFAVTKNGAVRTLTFATAIAAIGPFVALRMPPDLVWHTFGMPLACLASAAALDRGTQSSIRWIRIAVHTLAIALLANTATQSWDMRKTAHTELFEQLGQVLSDAAAAPEWAAAHCWPFAQAYYYDSPRIPSAGFTIPQHVAILADNYDGYGWKYVWLKPTNPHYVAKGMEEYLSQFPRVRAPSLETDLDLTGRGPRVSIAEAWVYTLCEPRED